MTSHKEQPAVDTSAEKLLALAGRVRSYLNLQGGIQLTTLLQDCDATLRSLAAHPAEPEDDAKAEVVAATEAWMEYERDGGVSLEDVKRELAAEPEGMELETTAEEWAVYSERKDWRGVAARFSRDFERMRARAEKAEAEARSFNDAAVEASILAHGWMQAHDLLKAGKPYKLPSTADKPALVARVETLEAALATYQQPVGDEEVEKLRSQCDDALGALDSAMSEQTHRYHSDPPQDAEYTIAFAVLKKVEEALHKVYFALPALSTQLRDAQARGKGMEEALTAERAAIEAEARRYAGHYTEGSDGRNTFLMLASWIADRAALSRPEGSAP